MKKIIILAVLAIIAVKYVNNNDYIEIPSSSIRLRVIAASNNQKDQKDKMIVKDALVQELDKELKNVGNYDSADAIMKENIKKIEGVIKKTIEENKIDENFTVNYGLNYFPEKTYKGITYKAGNYQSLVVTLQEGKGENWWCALYPPICQIDENKTINDYRFLIKDLISQYN